MSKILIDEETLYAVIDALNIGYLISSGKEQQRIFAERNKLLDELQKTKKRYSVLEWHPMSEAPSSNARVFVEYSDGGFGFVFGHPEIIKDDPDYKRWAYLPE